MNSHRNREKKEVTKKTIGLGKRYPVSCLRVARFAAVCWVFQHGSSDAWNTARFSRALAPGWIFCPSWALPRPARFALSLARSPYPTPKATPPRLPAALWGSATLSPRRRPAGVWAVLGPGESDAAAWGGKRPRPTVGCQPASVRPRGRLHILLRAVVSQPGEGRTRRTQQERRLGKHPFLQIAQSHVFICACRAAVIGRRLQITWEQDRLEAFTRQVKSRVRSVRILLI